ncbi:MAG TPA: class I SAM-dependent methyltransferase [Vicinamibacteria bacterium]|jgi:caffeoyl-CoA O-methyltransferase
MIALVDEKIETYATNHTSEEPELLARLARETKESMEVPQMLTGRLEGNFLRLMVRALQARRVLEVGMFTGYSALMMAEALPDDGRIITCEVNPKAEEVARRYFAESPHGHKIDVRMGPAIETIKRLDGPFDFVFIDADKENYPTYYDLCLERVRAGGAIAIDNVLWSGHVLNPQDEETRAIVAVNEKVLRDDRVDNALLTIRDGVMLAVKK